jgi:hypothetical protein
VPEPGGEAGVDEQRVAGVALERRPPLDLAHHLGVEPDADVEQEVPAVRRAEPDRLDGAPGQPGQQVTGRLDRVVREPHRPREHVGRPSRQHGERGVGAGEAVGRLVQRAVAAEDRDHLDADVGRALGEAGGVAPAAGLGEGHVVVGPEGLLDDHPTPGGHR